MTEPTDIDGEDGSRAAMDNWKYHAAIRLDRTESAMSDVKSQQRSNLPIYKSTNIGGVDGGRTVMDNWKYRAAIRLDWAESAM